MHPALATKECFSLTGPRTLTWSNPDNASVHSTPRPLEEGLNEPRLILQGSLALSRRSDPRLPVGLGLAGVGVAIIVYSWLSPYSPPATGTTTTPAFQVWGLFFSVILIFVGVSLIVSWFARRRTVLRSNRADDDFRPNPSYRGSGAQPGLSALHEYWKPPPPQG